MKTIIFLTILLLLAGCSTEETSLGGTGVNTNIKIGSDADKEIMEQCIELCNDYQQDKSNGPCLGDPMIADYVCDIAHVPRQDIDNDINNQCQSFNTGEAKHFIEVDENCGFLRMK